MGTEILHPQDFLMERLKVGPSFLPHHKAYNPNSYPNPNSNSRTSRKPITRLDPKKRVSQPDPLISKKSTVDESKSTKNFVVGQVTILKRGESLDSKRKTGSGAGNGTLKKTFSEDLVLYGTERLGPDPEMVPKQIRITDLKSLMISSSSLAVRSDVYAGSAFALSPSPSSLPLPTFSVKKEGLAVIDDSATKDLRRLLRID